MSYYEQNREARLAYRRAYRETHEASIKAYAVKHYLAHNAHRVHRIPKPEKKLEKKPKKDRFMLDGNPKPPKEKVKPIVPETPKARPIELIPYTAPMERGMFSLSFM
tara:strand:+ start:484 stop:804 length:321 start_codon:yes stop_codon:yes gene_type:complete